MSWTKLGDEFADDAADLSDSAYRTHTEALQWSNRRLLDLSIPKRDLLRFAFSAAATESVTELVESGWWVDRGNHWWIGVKWPEWQQSRDQVQHKREQWSKQQDRSRRHRIGDHSACLARNCKDALSAPDTAADSETDSTDDPGRVGVGSVSGTASSKQNHVQTGEPLAQLRSIGGAA